jgi:threonylcarbamoyladenosine tRNA methylthiotransferase MtaB
MEGLENSRTGRAAVCSLGCKVNTYEAQGMQELLQQAGYEIVDIEEQADVYLINTCTVTQIAARKSRQMIHRLRHQNPKAVVIAAGCYVEKDTSLLDDGTVDLIVPNRRKKDLLLFLDAYRRGVDAHHLSEDAGEAAQDLHITAQEGKTRVFLKVQDGCRQFCTYCIIPYVRGPLYSKPLADCVAEATALAEQGYQEVVLTGIHLSSYGRDAGYDLGDLILAIQQIPGIVRIRLGSMEPRMITPEFLAKIRPADKLCPHFHLSLQSGCDRTLASMNRHYTTEEYAQAVRRLREQYPIVAVTTDVIVGFPGESEEDHQASLRFVRDMHFAQVHVFRYSKRTGTVAERMIGQVDEKIKRRRSEEMLAVTRAEELAYEASRIGARVEVLAEEKDPETGLWMGHTTDYLKVGIASDKELRGQRITVTLTEPMSDVRERYMKGIQ